MEHALLPFRQPPLPGIGPWATHGDGRAGHAHSLASFFSDERRKVLDMIRAPTLEEAEAAYDAVYEHHAPLIRFLKGSGAPTPKVLPLAADVCLNTRIGRIFQGTTAELPAVRPLLEEARLAGASLDPFPAGLGSFHRASRPITFKSGTEVAQKGAIQRKRGQPLQLTP